MFYFCPGLRKQYAAGEIIHSGPLGYLLVRQAVDGPQDEHFTLPLGQGLNSLQDLVKACLGIEGIIRSRRESGLGKFFGETLVPDLPYPVYTNIFQQPDGVGLRKPDPVEAVPGFPQLKTPDSSI